MFHSLTGCDTVSSFVGHGEKMAWATWNVMPELTNALLQLSSAPSDIGENGRVYSLDWTTGFQFLYLEFILLD